MSYINTGISFDCPKCKTQNSPNITNQDLERNKTITLTCDNCSYSEERSTNSIINEIKKEAMKGLENYFK